MFGLFRSSAWDLLTKEEKKVITQKMGKNRLNLTLGDISKAEERGYFPKEKTEIFRQINKNDHTNFVVEWEDWNGSFKTYDNKIESVLAEFRYCASDSEKSQK